MKIMVIVKASKDSEAVLMPSTELLAEMGNFNEELVKAGIMLAGEGLHPSSKGARVHFSGNKRTVIDGPFTETKELIAGFWLWRVNSLQEAIEWVKKCPNPMNEDSEIEIRQVFEAADFGEEFTPELRMEEASLRARTLGLNAPTFRERPGMLVAGLNERYDMESRSGIPGQWERFVSRSSEIPNQAGPDFYGICNNFTNDCQFDYLTAVEVSCDDGLPEGLTSLRLEPRPYAVFAHTQHVSSLPRTIETIWSKWVPDCGLKVAQQAACLERYTSEFDASTGMGGLEIWVPLQSY